MPPRLLGQQNAMPDAHHSTMRSSDRLPVSNEVVNKVAALSLTSLIQVLELLYQMAVRPIIESFNVSQGPWLQVSCGGGAVVG